MFNSLIIALGKAFSKTSNLLNLGSGSTWPGHIALKINDKFIRQIVRKNKAKIVLIAGTNGKTTTSKLIQEILTKNGYKVFRNKSGANLINGIASTLIQSSSLSGNIDKSFGIFEIDENSLPQVLTELSPNYLILLDLFRDQLDRYGEIDSIAKKWRDAIKDLDKKTTLIVNADDPLIAYLGNKINAKVKYFGLRESGTNIVQHASDSVYCPKCGTKLEYKTIFFSHLGDWYCPNCKLKRPEINMFSIKKYPLLGTYNKYNTLAAVLTSESIGLNQEKINKALTGFKPAFGRQETSSYKGKNVQIFLSKNPTSFNQSFKTVILDGAKNILIVLNDKIPDGRDVSWIWDFDLEGITGKNITVSGDRTFDLALRLKYEGVENFVLEPNLKKAINSAIEKTPENEMLYILPTYSAMLETRKIITGRKIL